MRKLLYSVVASAAVLLCAGCANQAPVDETTAMVENLAEEESKEDTSLLPNGKLNLRQKQENVKYFIRIDGGEKKEITEYIREFHEDQPYISADGMGKIFGMAKVDVTEEDKERIAMVEEESGMREDHYIMDKDGKIVDPETLTEEERAEFEIDEDMLYVAYEGNGTSFVFKEGSPIYLVDKYPSWNTNSVYKNENGGLDVCLTKVAFEFGYERVACDADNGEITFALYSPSAYEAAESLEFDEPIGTAETASPIDAEDSLSDLAEEAEDAESSVKETSQDAELVSEMPAAEDTNEAENAGEIAEEASGEASEVTSEEAAGEIAETIAEDAENTRS